MTSARHNTPEENDAIDRWWAEPRTPRRPVLKLIEIPAYAPTITVTCRACEARDTVAVDWPGLLCRKCRTDLDATEARLNDAIAACVAAGERDTDAWLNYQAGLDDALADRWTTLVHSRDTCKARLERALTGKKRRETPETIQAEINAARAAWNEMENKIHRTQSNPDNPLSALLQAEALYQAAMKQHTDRLQALQLGLAEIDVARGESLL